MKTTIQKIGNSKGVIIPANLLKEYGFEDEVSIELQEDGLVLSKPKSIRAGWEEGFSKVSVDTEKEALFLDGVSNEFDDDEWTW